MNVGALTVHDYTTTQPFTPIHSIEETLLNINYIIVKDHDKYLGIVETSDIIKKPHKLVVDCIVPKPELDWFESVENAYPYIYQKKHTVLPVFKYGEFAGVLTNTRILDHYYSRQINISGLFSELLNAVPEGMIIYSSSDASILHFNTNVTHFVGIDVHGKKITNIFPEIDSAFFLKSSEKNEPVTIPYVSAGNGKSLTITIKTTEIINQQYGLVVIREQGRFIQNLQEISSNEDVHELLNRNKSHFLQCVSHELRTPISGIMGMANLLSNEKLDDNSKKYVTMLKNAAHNLFASVNDILDFEQLEDGVFQLHNTSFNLKIFLEENTGLFQLLAHNKGLEFISDINVNEGCIVHGDQLRLRQILLNLVSNAVKFTEKGNVSLKADIFMISENSYNARFIVADTGYGISQSNLKKIFEPYFQETSHNNQKYEEYGLGLSIVNQLVRTMKGEIHVESDISGGTVFSVNLPFEAGKVVPQIDCHDLPLMRTLRPLKILVAEDEAINNLYICQMLKKKGFLAVSVNNGIEVINRLKNEDFDLVLMDISMPEMDGLEATKVIRNTLRSRIRIIALTAHAYDDMKEQCLAAGMDDYISKPVNDSVLQDKIGSFFNQ